MNKNAFSRQLTQFGASSRKVALLCLLALTAGVASGQTQVEPDKVLFAGDNFYHSFPNLYAIRDTVYRDVLSWSESVGKMAELHPHVVVPGHTMPIKGQEAATTALKNYSESISMARCRMQ